MKKKFSIRLTILVSFLFILMMTCGAIIYYNYSHISDVFLEDIEEDIDKATSVILHQTYDYLLPAKITTQFIAWFSKGEENILDASEDVAIQSIKMLDLYPQIAGFYHGDSHGNLVSLLRVKKGDTYPYGKKQPLPVNARYEIKTINRNSAVIVEYSKYVDIQGRTVAIQERPRSSEYFDPRNRPWYKGAAKNKAPYWSDPYVFENDQIVGITATTPILSKDGKVRIVISADITMEALSKNLKENKVGKKSLTFILNQDGGIVGYPDISKMNVSTGSKLSTYEDTNNPVLIKAYENFKQTNQYSFNMECDDVLYLVRFKEIGEKWGKDWVIGFIVPRDELTAPVDHMTNLMMIFSLIVLSISSILIFIISRNIAKPITIAANKMVDIANFKINGGTIKQSYFSEIQLMNRALEHMQQSLRDFSRFVPKAVVTKLIKSGSGAKIGGRNHNITLMFTDIKGFTSISEKMSSEKLILHLSDYLNQLTHIIQENNGTIDKYIGDAIMTFWGAPIDDPNHPISACRSAILCKNRLDILNKKWSLDGKPPLITRFGVHTGDAIVGNVGSEDRLNYSAFGDGVNLASRLENINKYYGTTITISHETYKNVRHKFICRPMDIVAVKGKDEGVPIYELLIEQSDEFAKKLDIEAAQSISDITTEAFKFYLAQEWAKSIEKYDELKRLNPNDLIPDIFITRCREFKKTPPAEGWTGTFVMMRK